MNNVQSLIDRQLGFYCRLDYDNVLKRLAVDESESYYGLHDSNVVAIYDHDPPIFACRFAEAAGYEHILALANENGRVAIQDTSTIKKETSLEGIQCHNNAVFDLVWMPGHMSFVTVSGDHTACLWDVTESGARRVLSFSAHTRSVKTAAFRPLPAAPGVFASGARDGHVLVWDCRAGSTPAVVLKPDNWLASCHSGAVNTPGSHGKRARIDAPRAISITGLAFRDDVTLFSCGECDGNVKVWDLRKNYSAYKREPLPMHSIPYCGSSTRNGFTNLIVDESRTRLYASCMDNVIYCFNVATCTTLPERRYVGHENGSFYIKTGLSPDGSYLVSGSSDKHAYVWNVSNSRPVVKLAAHRAEVTCAAWCQRGDTKIVTCSDDARHNIWRIGKEMPDKDELRGWAEVIPTSEKAPAWGTPSIRRATTPSSQARKRSRIAAPSRKTKRCLTPVLDAASDTDAAKRFRMDNTERPGATSTGVKRARAETPPPQTECTMVTPKKHSSPKEITPRKLAIISFSTPTIDLPNWVLNGEAPHLRLMSPPRKKLATTDWLTKLCQSRREPFVPVPMPLTPKENLPPRRNSVTEKTPKSVRKSRTLLKYFTVARKAQLK